LVEVQIVLLYKKKDKANKGKQKFHETKSNGETQSKMLGNAW